MILALIPALAAAHGEHLDTIPGTRWSLRPEDHWSEAYVETLTALAARLPPEYRDPGVDVEFVLRSAPDLTAEGNHALGHIDPLRPKIKLWVDGLQDGLGETALAVALGGDSDGVKRGAAQLLQRVTVHELTHLLDRRLGLSRQDEWRDLSGWNWWSRMLIPTSPVDTREFATSWGSRSPAEDLASFAEVYFNPPLLGPFDGEDAPKCKFPRKFEFFATAFGEHPNPTPMVRCSGPRDVGLALESIGDIELVFATPSLAQIASVAGHVFLAIEVRDGPESHWETFTLGAAVDSESTPPGYLILLGLLGGYESTIVRRPFELVRQDYVWRQQRDILRFRWLLSDAEKERLVQRLDDMLLHWHRPYMFLQRNCTALIQELIAAVDQEPVDATLVLPPDKLLADLIGQGRIIPLPVDEARDLSSATRARLLAGSSEDSIEVRCGPQTSALQPRSLEQRGRTYSALLQRAEESGDLQCWEDLARLLSYTGPTDQALLARTGLESLPERERALDAVRQELPTEARVKVHEAVDAQLHAAMLQQPQLGAAALATPYRTGEVGARMELGSGASGPMIFARRTLLDIDYGRPTLIPPARGLDLRLLDLELAVGLAPVMGPHFRSTLLAVRYQPESPIAGPMPLLRVSLGKTELDLSDRRVALRWADLQAGMTLFRASDGHAYLDTSTGVDLNTTLSGRLNRGFELGVPLTVHGAWYSRSSRGLGIEDSFLVRGALEPGTAPGLQVANELDAWIYLHRVGDRLISLHVKGYYVASLFGEPTDEPASLSFGIRAERI